MRLVSRVCRLISLVVLAVLGTCLLMYVAPGYFADAREMDAAHTQTVQADLANLRTQQGSVGHVLRQQAASWFRGDLGTSRQYGTPVAGLVRERCLVSLRLLAAGVALGWLGALVLALPHSLRRTPVAEVALTGATALLLAVPAGLLAMVCMVSGHGGPVLVLALLVGVRDLKLLQRMLHTAWTAPHILQAHAHGLRSLRILRAHVLPALRGDLLALAVMSFTLALSALVPVEVIFDAPGLGQLAWSAAMNRDMPVLTTVTALMATCVGVAGLLQSQASSGAAAPCA